MQIEVSLPYPRRLSVNEVLKKGRNGIYLNPRVKSYRKEIWALFFGKGQFGKEKLKVEIHMWPTKESCDIDNILKTLLDAMQHAGVYENDCQIVELLVKKFHVEHGGRIWVRLSSV